MSRGLMRFAKGSNYLPNQVFQYYYRDVKTKAEIEETINDRANLSYDEIEQIIKNKVDTIEGIGYVEKIRRPFKCAEGTEDVYKKSGFTQSLETIIPREMFDKMNWRVITDAGHIDFKVGGIVESYDKSERYTVIQVVYAFSTGATPNTLRGFPKASERLRRRKSPKLLILE